MEDRELIMGFGYGYLIIPENWLAMRYLFTNGSLHWTRLRGECDCEDEFSSKA